MRVTEKFRSHVESVRQLMCFDRTILDVAINALEEAKERLEKIEINNPKMIAANALTSLRGVREHDSLRPQYEAIFNQALVLLVSYFASVVHDLFRAGVQQAIESSQDLPLLKVEMKMTFREFKDASEDFPQTAADLLIKARDISFQDMQSVSRAFKDHLGVSVPRDQRVNDIILGQACRHVIVHAGGIVDDRLVRQISGATPRSLKQQMTPGAAVQFKPEEVEIVAVAMTQYLVELSEQISKNFGVNV